LKFELYEEGAILLAYSIPSCAEHEQSVSLREVGRNISALLQYHSTELRCVKK
jgi:hypothetical protein